MQLLIFSAVFVYLRQSVLAVNQGLGVVRRREAECQVEVAVENSKRKQSKSMPFSFYKTGFSYCVIRGMESVGGSAFNLPVFLPFVCR